jgi:hypothetical protein
LLSGCVDWKWVKKWPKYTAFYIVSTTFYRVSTSFLDFFSPSLSLFFIEGRRLFFHCWMCRYEKQKWSTEAFASDKRRNNKELSLFLKRTKP